MEIASSKAEVAEGDIIHRERVSCQTLDPISGTSVCHASCASEIIDAHRHPESLDVQLLAEITEATRIALEEDPDYARRPLSVMNKEAAELQRSGQPLKAVAAYCKLFRKVKERNIIHAELYTCLSNRASAYLQLGLWEEALADAERARALAEMAMKVTRRSIPGFVKTFLRKGMALNGLQRYREASLALEEGLQMDPFNPAIKAQLEVSTQGVLSDLLQGKGLETRALPAPEATQRITNHAHSTPLHRLQTDQLLPTKLLTPFQAGTPIILSPPNALLLDTAWKTVLKMVNKAESQHDVKDTYNYVTIKTDIRMPARHVSALHDSARCHPWQQAVKVAVARLAAEHKDVRMLHLGAGAGLLAMTALQAGAHHVTAVERWLYLSLACKETLAKNVADPLQYSVIYKRPTDLALGKDVRICCNLLVCDMFDEGLLTSGLIPCMRHAIQNLMADDMVLLPASATVHVQAVEMRTQEVCGVDISPVNQHRWHPGYLSGVPLGADAYTALSHPVEAWHFDLGAPPEESDHKALDLHFHSRGRMNAVLFWFDLQLIDGITFSTRPQAVAAGLKSMGPALQYLAGELSVDAGLVIPLQATHNTVGMRFEISEADYHHLAKPDASFPIHHLHHLSDIPRHQAFKEAVQRRVATYKKLPRGAHVLDLGCGTGFTATAAALAGAHSVTACDLHTPMTNLTRRVVAVNGVSEGVSVVPRDVALLERGRDVRALGVNILVADFFDAGLVGNNFLYQLEVCKRKIAQPDCRVIPSAATLYCMGIQTLTPAPGGFDFSALDKFRWDKGYENCRLAEVPHIRLTKPVKVFDFCLDGASKPRGRDNLLKLPVERAGCLNAIAFWFDLHLDDVCTITSAPENVDVGGSVPDAIPEGNWQQSTSQAESTPRTAASPEEMQADLVTCLLEVNSPNQEIRLIIQDAVDQERHMRSGRAESYGQALQHLDCCLDVVVGDKVTLVVKRDGPEIRFKLREGVGKYVERAPWKIEWGGGSSVENPHFQRVHYCELLVSDFLQRVKGGRFPTIEKDMQMVLSHCGSLLLDQAALCQVYQELVVLERLHTAPEFSPGVSLEAVYRPALCHC